MLHRTGALLPQCSKSSSQTDRCRYNRGDLFVCRMAEQGEREREVTKIGLMMRRTCDIRNDSGFSLIDIFWHKDRSCVSQLICPLQYSLHVISRCIYTTGDGIYTAIINIC